MFLPVSGKFSARAPVRRQSALLTHSQYLNSGHNMKKARAHR